MCSATTQRDTQWPLLAAISVITYLGICCVGRAGETAQERVSTPVDEVGRTILGHTLENMPQAEQMKGARPGRLYRSRHGKVRIRQQYLFNTVEWHDTCGYFHTRGELDTRS